MSNLVESIRKFFEVNPVIVDYFNDSTTGNRVSYEFSLDLFKKFAKFWLEKAQAEDVERRFTEYGLCSNYIIWLERNPDLVTQEVTDEDAEQFTKYHYYQHAIKKLFWVCYGGADPVIDIDAYEEAYIDTLDCIFYPFGGEALFDEELDFSIMHKSTLRIAFIQAILEA